MRQIKILFIASLCFIFLGFVKNQVVELEQHLNARASENFLPSTNNVITTLPKGSKGSLIDYKKFNSGNYGLKIRVIGGEFDGQDVWVYYRTESPGIKLYQKEDLKDSTNKVEAARSLQTQRNLASYKEQKIPDRDSSVDANSADELMKTVNQKLKNKQPECLECIAQKSFAAGKDAVASGQDKGVFRPIPNEHNPMMNPSSICRSKGSVDFCYTRGESDPIKTVFRNTVSKKIIGRPSEGRFREWNFSSENSARQDLGLFVSDNFNGSEKNKQESYLMFFPRKSLPATKTVGENTVVTLPTGETVTFNSQNQIVNGALSEDAMGGSAPKVSYRGSGVVLKASKAGAYDPRFGAEPVIISKGDQSCNVSKKELWPDQTKSSGLHFKYASDAEFERFLQKRCGFGFN